MYIWPGPVRDQTSIQEFTGSILIPATYLSLRFGHKIISTAIPYCWFK